MLDHNLYNEILAELKSTNKLLSTTNELLSKLIVLKSNNVSSNTKDDIGNNLDSLSSEDYYNLIKNSSTKSQQCSMSKPFYI